MSDLQGRAALVTGSTSGIGQGIAQALQAAGAQVLRHGVEATTGALQADLLRPEAPFELMRQAFEIAPELDVLVCNAGSFFDAPFLEMTPDAWDKTMHLNARAPYFLIQEFARRLVAQKRGGAVIVVGSTNGFRPEHDSTAYDISKGAIVMLTRSLALALAEHDIRVNCIAPGLIRTPLTARWLDEQPQKRAHYEKSIPLGRIGVPHDCGGVAVFLASPAAAYLTGQIIVVDGGLTLPQIGKFDE